MPESSPFSSCFCCQIFTRVFPDIFPVMPDGYCNGSVFFCRQASKNMSTGTE
jgi:hypothetical protein